MRKSVFSIVFSRKRKIASRLVSGLSVIILSTALFLSISTPAYAAKVIYKIKIQTEQGTDNYASIRLWGEETKAWSEYFDLKGDQESLDYDDYALEDQGAISWIQLKLSNTVPFGDDWTPTWIEIEHPWPAAAGVGYAKSRFVLGDEVDSGGRSKSYEGTITSRPPVTVTQNGVVVKKTKLITVAHFFNNETSSPYTTMKVKETWQEVNSVALSEVMTTSSETAVSASYESPDTVVGKFGATASQTWGSALTRATENTKQKGYSTEQDWSFTIAPNTAMFRSLILKVPIEYVPFESSKGEKRWVRKPGGPVQNTGTGRVFEFPKKNPDGTIKAVSWKMIKTHFHDHLDEANKTVAAPLVFQWMVDGWIYDDVATKPGEKDFFGNQTPSTPWRE